MFPTLWYALIVLADGLSKIRSYIDNGDNTVSDEVTGLMWEKSMEKITWQEAIQRAETARSGGYSDWRLPSLKELYSLILYSGSCRGDYSIELFIDPIFDQPLGDTTMEGGREIDAQTWSATDFDGRTMGNDIDTAFGVNFIDGRVKAYPKRLDKYCRYVRGNLNYGTNIYIANNDGTISDESTGLM